MCIHRSKTLICYTINCPQKRMTWSNSESFALTTWQISCGWGVLLCGSPFRDQGPFFPSSLPPRQGTEREASELVCSFRLEVTLPVTVHWHSKSITSVQEGKGLSEGGQARVLGTQHSLSLHHLCHLCLWSASIPPLHLYGLPQT